MQLLLINPNTTESITALIAREAGRILGGGVGCRAVTGRFGARYIASRAAAAVAGHAALDALAEHGAGADAVLLACFGDPGLEALKEVAEVPVVGMAEASCHLASLLGRRFAIVTGCERWGPMLEEFVAAHGLRERLATILTVAPTGAAIAADPEGSVRLLADRCREAASRDGADVVILGGAGLAGLAGPVGAAAGLPVVCSLEAGLRATLAAGALRASAGTATRPQGGVGSIGLSPALAGMLALRG